MKKFIMGLIVGALVATAGTAFAEDIVNGVTNLVGKTIQGQFPVTVDGETIEMPAIVVDGTSFLPVRKFAETVGYAVYFDPEGEILLDRLPTDPVTVADSQARYDAIKADQAVQKQQEPEEITSTVSSEVINSQLDSLRDQLNSETIRLNKYENVVLEILSNPDLTEEGKKHAIDLRQPIIDSIVKNIDDLEAQIADLEAQLQPTQ